MTFLNLYTDPTALIISWIYHSIAYYCLLNKMSLKRRNCLIPFLAERQFSTLLFRRMRSFYRPFVVAVVLMAAALYLGVDESMGWVYAISAFIVYGVFVIRLYWRLAKAFGKGRLFALGLILVPVIFLMILAFGRSRYQGIDLKPVREHSKAGRFVRRAGLVLISAAEITVLVLGIGLLTVRTLPPEILVDQNLSEIHDKTKDLQGDGQVLTREDMMGKAAASAADMKPSRAHFFPDHSADKNVVVMTYVIGSNLEHKAGLATANITQMIDATKQGDGLTFVMQAGGANRWFTDGIDAASYGRYEIAGGNLTKVKGLQDNISMSDRQSLEDFLKWTKKNYPADRYMLVLWDHGGGVCGGYGQDDINSRTEESNDFGTMQVNEILDAVKACDTKFDVIGFDACLMQDIEIAAAMEPYADYYLASEETEGGYGWFYTSAFGKLAADPGLPTEEFAEDLLSTYDQLNTIIKDANGEPDTGATLSLVDTTLAKPAYQAFCDFLERADKIIREDPGAYADFAVAGTNAYNFTDNMQIDLVDFLTILQKADYDDSLGSDQQMQNLTNTIRSCVLYRNKASASGINGMAFAFPYKAIHLYGDTSDQLKNMSLKTERRVFNDIFSIMAAQQKKAAEQETASEDASLWDEMFGTADYTKESWYVKGFEDYEDAEALVDIPLKETADGYEIQMPEKLWKIIADSQTVLYQNVSGKSGEGMRYLGTDYLGAEDASGHPMVTMDDTWVHIEGQAVCYEADQVRETEEGDVYTGKVKARLNGKRDIVLYIEWEPVKDDTAPMVGSVTGYDTVLSEKLGSYMDTKGLLKLKAGDTVQFLFDTYDAEGNLIKTSPEGKKIRVSKQGRLTVEDAQLEAGSYTFCGVLTDVYQRTMTTEMVEATLGE